MEYCLVLCACPAGDAAQSLAEILVRERLAACVNILPGVLSVYVWQGALEHSPESLLLMKTRRDAYPQLETRLRALHPYELPEIVAIDIDHGLPEYLNWISQCLSSAP
ncbi:MAG: divalent-cation tolerance protein CutA [Candidatus Methylumidiphilus sp.]